MSKRSTKPTNKGLSYTRAKPVAKILQDMGFDMTVRFCHDHTVDEIAETCYPGSSEEMISARRMITQIITRAGKVVEKRARSLDEVYNEVIGLPTAG